MASCKLKRFIAISIVLVLCLLWIPAESVRTKTKIYIDLKTQSFCFRILNATHQAGCTSSNGGNVGVLYYIHEPEDFDWVLSKGPHAPYIAVLTTADFNGTSVKRLYGRRDRVNGIMVINHRENSTSPATYYPEDGFSAVDACPNDKSGLYGNSSDYGACKKTTWNKAGSGLLFEDIGVPVFALSDPVDVNAVMNRCILKFNLLDGGRKPARDYPLCAAEMKAHMAAAVDAVMCLRRTDRLSLSFTGERYFCDPLGDFNNYVTMLDVPQNVTRPDGSVIVVGARVDSTSLFQNEYHAADTSLSGIVGLLATMEALWKVQNVIKSTKQAKDIMFAFFQGEVYNYIGSSRMVYDMLQGKFPHDLMSDLDSLHLQTINLKSIGQFVELNQVGRRDDADSLWLHSDPTSRSTARKEVQQMIQRLKAATADLNVTMQEADEAQPLPPSSSQRFLLERKDIPVVVITDHQAEFTNKFYNSRLDGAELINATDYPPGMKEADKYDFVTTQAEMLATLSTALARYLFTASTGKEPDEDTKKTLTASPSTVTHLLYCFMVNPNCKIFRESVSPSNLETLEKAKQPFPFYVGVRGQRGPVTSLIYNLMARFTGTMLDRDQSNCWRKDKDMRYNYVFFQGNVTDKGWCLKTLAQTAEAVSPAFLIDDYNMKSGKYSTWVESRWISTSARLFLVPSQELQVSMLAIGVVVLVLSLVLVYWCSAHASHIFILPPAGSGDETTYSPML